MTRGRFWYIRRKSRTVASEVDEELSLHLEMRVQELQSQGMSAGEARREALRQFGDLERTRQYCRRQDEQKESEMQRSLWFQDVVQDARISFSMSGKDGAAETSSNMRGPVRFWLEGGV